MVGDGLGDVPGRRADLCREEPAPAVPRSSEGVLEPCEEIDWARAVEEASAGVVCCLCDDDLLLPEHVADMVPSCAGRTWPSQ